MRKNKFVIITVALVLCILAGTFAIPKIVSAANNTVTITSASATGSSMTVSGTTSAKAVAVQIRNTSGTIYGMGTLGVSGGSFSGTINNLRIPNGDYKIYVADYEGGSWAIEEVTVTGSSATSSGATTVTAVKPSCANGHDYIFTVILAPTRVTDGYGAWVCSRCGAIDKNHPGTDENGYLPLSSYWQYQKESIEQIQNAPAGTLTINAEFWISFHKSVYEEIEKRPDLTVTVNFRWEGKRYAVTIPAGTKAADCMNGLDYAGYVYLSSLFGFTEIGEDEY